MILSGEQIAKRWPIIKSALKLSAMPLANTNEEKLKNILRALLSGHAICWMTGNERRPRTVVVLIIATEAISDTKNLLVYCAHGFEKETPKQYAGILKGIQNYALKRGCENILCYVWNDKIKETLVKYGAECNYTLAVFPLH